MLHKELGCSLRQFRLRRKPRYECVQEEFITSNRQNHWLKLLMRQDIDHSNGNQPEHDFGHHCCSRRRPTFLAELSFVDRFVCPQ